MVCSPSGTATLLAALTLGRSTFPVLDITAGISRDPAAIVDCAVGAPHGGGRTRWFRRRITDIDCDFLYCGDASFGDDPDAEVHPSDTDTVAEALRALREEIDFARASTDGVALDELARADPPWTRIRGWRPTLRWIMVHMIEEYARHCGHADLLREAVDGTTGD